VDETLGGCVAERVAGAVDYLDGAGVPVVSAVVDDGWLAVAYAGRFVAVGSLCHFGDVYM